METLTMSIQTIETILELNKRLKLKDIPVLSRALKLHGVVTPLKSNDTIEHVLDKLRVNDPDVLSMTVREILHPRSRTEEWCSNIKSVIMWFVLIIMSGAYTASNIYISVTSMTPIQWEDMFLPLISPILLVLHERGVVSKENRDTLSAISGLHPAMTLLESISQRIANVPNTAVTSTAKVEKSEAPKIKETDY